ncbi:MAG: GDP-mannose 4,6-dehydratase [Deltaproteobacteria bacterium]|nr:GDP-mannose 4,6-dehydratase [Deltaproteobacteria bacterium]
MRKVLITGIAGFAGSHLAERLAGRFEVWGLRIDANLSNLEGIKGLSLVECDMTDYGSLSSAVERIKPDAVYHLAGQSLPSVSFKHPGETLRTNIFSTLNLFEALSALSPETVVLNIGSADEYGEVREEDLPVDEETELRPLNPYAVSKVTQDLLAFQYHKSKGLKIVRARPFNHIGGRQAPAFVASEFAKRIAEIEAGIADGNTLTVGNLDVAKDFLDVRDVVAAYELLVEKGVHGEVYNICSGTATRIREIADKLISFSTRRIEIAQDPSKKRPTDTLAIYGDNSRVRALGWSPERSLDETLKDLLDYWRGRVRRSS